MNTRSIAFLLTVVGICLGTSQLQADEPAESDQVTQVVCEPVAGDECGPDRTDAEAWMICEEWMAYEAAIAIDEVIEPAVANENEPQEADETLAETITDEDLIQEFKCVEGFDGWIVERDFEAEGLTEEKDESLESEAVVREETVQVDADDAVQILEEAATDESETTEEKNFANQELTGGSIWIAIFDADFDEGGFAVDESIQEEIAAEETVDDIESAEVEDNVAVVESEIEERTCDDTPDNVETEEAAVAQTTEEIAINGDLALDAEASSEESVDVEVSAGEPTEESSEQKIDEEITVENAIDVVEPTIEEEGAVEETVEATDDVASPVAVETLDEESFEQETVEDVQDAADACEDITTDGVVDNEETLEVVEPLIEEVELPETESESTAGDDVNESETGTVRTIELGGCKVTIQSDRQMDDFELLDLLWEAVGQLEAEMD